MIEPDPHHEGALIKRAGARCECQGECGENHAWEAGLPAQRCRAPHGCNIRRKKDHPTSWVLAELQGWEDNRDDRTQLTDADGQVTRGGRTWPLAFPEFYRPRIVHVKLEAVDLTKDKRAAFCQRCALLMKRKATT
jgi:hypothetical protein